MIPQKYSISTEKLTFKTIHHILSEKPEIILGDEATQRIKACREYLERKTASGKEPIYGINTGFGALYHKTIPQHDLGKLQENLVKSHACGVGEEVPHDIVRLMLLLKIQSLFLSLLTALFISIS